MKRYVFFVLILSVNQLLWAQSDTVSLKEINLSDYYLLHFSDTQTKQFLSDSVIKKNGPLLTQLLNTTSGIYMKENGAGMVSSPSFRGTTASQTAVLWNGININSQFLGQTDFNTVNTFVFDNILIKPGGGSAAYGSAAIGGAIYLNNSLRFNQGFENTIFTRFGSFNTYSLNYNPRFSNENLSFNLAIGKTASDNDYPYLNQNRKNENGEFYNHTLSLSAAHKLDSRNQLKFYGNLFDGSRNFALISTNSLPTKYQDYNTRSLIEWENRSFRFSSQLKLAHLSENFRYYPSLTSKNYEFGENQSWIAQYNLTTNFRSFLLNLLFDFKHSEGKGTQIHFAKRQNGSAGFILKQKINSKLLYEAGIRQEFSSDYKAPFLYSFGFKWDATSFYQIRFHFSKNFRMPTFNDLYWPGSGNLNLLPETSLQMEVGNRIYFNGLELEITAYSTSVKNLIQWIPKGAISKPENVGKVKILGIESRLNYKKKWHYQQIEFNLSYHYNFSEDERKEKQLIYVPFHKSTASLAYAWKNLSAYYQFVFTGKVFTDTGNLYEINNYALSNVGLEWNFDKKRAYKIGTQIMNLWNKDYEIMLNRPMPGRNYTVYLNLNF
ncbi:MAG: TonB-dependent receptor [Weeksellaceae bacterium]|jgi:iron complex outermembrane receptor protein|nr:TonB-dependent receptor [Weeksellaceae bacterium]